MSDQVSNNRPIQPSDTRRTGRSSKEVAVHPDEHALLAGPPDAGDRVQDKPAVPPHDRHRADLNRGAEKEAT